MTPQTLTSGLPSVGFLATQTIHVLLAHSLVAMIVNVIFQTSALPYSNTVNLNVYEPAHADFSAGLAVVPT